MKIYLFLLFTILSVGYCDRCLQGILPVSEGASCSSTTRCRYGSFCNKNGICQKLLAAGESCEYSPNSCGPFLTCKGPTNERICVKYANLGESCTTDFSNTLSPCPRSCINQICVNGLIGDSCTSTSHCSLFLICAENTDIKKQVCTPVFTFGFPCNSTTSYICPPGSYCDDKACVARKTTGACNSQSECAWGYICTRNSQLDDTQCIPVESKLAGEYCEQNSACESLRCQSNSCAKKGNSELCSDSDDCSESASCRCSGNTKIDGVGKCTSNPCFSIKERLDECLYEHCRDSESDFEGSCSQNFCKKLTDSYSKCSGTSRIIFSSIALILSVLAVFFVSF